MGAGDGGGGGAPGAPPPPKLRDANMDVTPDIAEPKAPAVGGHAVVSHRRHARASQTREPKRATPHSRSMTGSMERIWRGRTYSPPRLFIAGAAAQQRIIMGAILACGGMGIPKPPKAGALSCCAAHSDLPCGTCMGTRSSRSTLA